MLFRECATPSQAALMRALQAGLQAPACITSQVKGTGTYEAKPATPQPGAMLCAACGHHLPGSWHMLHVWVTNEMCQPVKMGGSARIGRSGNIR